MSALVEAVRDLGVTPHVARGSRARPSMAGLPAMWVSHQPQYSQVHRSGLQLGQDDWRLTQDQTPRCAEGEGANRVYLCRLQSDPDGVAIRLALVDRQGGRAPVIRQHAGKARNRGYNRLKCEFQPASFLRDVKAANSASHSRRHVADFQQPAKGHLEKPRISSG